MPVDGIAPCDECGMTRPLNPCPECGENKCPECFPGDPDDDVCTWCELEDED